MHPVCNVNVTCKFWTAEPNFGFMKDFFIESE